MKSKAFQEVLKGTFQLPEECNPFDKKLLQALQKPPGIPLIPQRTLTNYTNGWKKA